MADLVDAPSTRAWLQSWFAAHGRVRTGILTSAIRGLNANLSIMSVYPDRYAESIPRTREALAVLTTEATPDGYPTRTELDR